MDPLSWQFFLLAHPESPFVQFFEACERLENGERSNWALNAMMAFVKQATNGGEDPLLLPPNTLILQAALSKITDGMAKRAQSRLLRMIRAMLDTLPKELRVATAMPRYGRQEPANALIRQTRVVLEDVIPKCTVPWGSSFFSWVVQSSAAGGWNTSATAKQIISMMHKFLRTTGWMDGTFLTHEDFSEYIREHVSIDDISVKCRHFVDTFCDTPESSKRYVHVFRLLFVAVWGKMTEEQFLKLKPKSQKRVIQSLEELDDILSSNNSNTMNIVDRTAFFTSEEEERIANAARVNPRDNMIITLLRTTGMRRRGIANILIPDVASLDDKSQWRAHDMGKTLTKGRHVHRFILHANAKNAIETWLNANEDAGGRPNSPSHFLLPSGRTDNGQMSVSLLTKIFKAVCCRAGFDLHDKRMHLHAMRHTCAHRLAELKNSPQQIAAQLGHKSTKTTEIYLTDSYKNITSTMTTPQEWESNQVGSGRTTPKQKIQTDKDGVAPTSLRGYIKQYQAAKKQK